jgi:hypothetical protein
MLKGRKAQARYFELGFMVDMGPASRWQVRGKRRSRWRESAREENGETN